MKGSGLPSLKEQMVSRLKSIILAVVLAGITAFLIVKANEGTSQEFLDNQAFALIVTFLSFCLWWIVIEIFIAWRAKRR